MDLFDGMKTFASVVEAGSFTAAADRLEISTKLASSYVARLEDRLGIRLLNRTTRSLSLTEAGQRYLPRCLELIAELEALEDSLRIGREAVTGVMRIASPYTFGEMYVLPFVRSFREMHPKLTIDVQLGDRYVDMSSEGFDLAIRIGVLESSALISRKLSQTQLWAVASPDYLKRNGEPEAPADLRKHNCIRDTNLRFAGSWPFLITGRVQKIQVDGRCLVNSAKAVRDMAALGEGIGLCPDYMATEDVAKGKLKRILINFPSTTLDIQAVYLSQRYMPAKVRTFIDFLGAAFKNGIGAAPLQRPAKKKAANPRA